MRIVETDNFGRDFPDEKFLNLPAMPRTFAQNIADAINIALCNHDAAQRYWKVVPDDYKLRPGFEP